MIVDPAELELDAAQRRVARDRGRRGPRERNVEILREYAQREPAGRVAPRSSCASCARRSRSFGEARDGAGRGLRVVRNRIERDDGCLRAVATGEEEVIDCGLVLRSIGYRGRPLPGVPVRRRGAALIRNDGGRVTGEDGDPLPGEYVVGWIKRGPSGVIGTNKKDAADTVARIIEDREAGPAQRAADRGPAAIEAWLRERVPGLVTWDGWQAIDAHETGLGEPHGRPRVKLVRVPEMISVAERRTTSHKPDSASPDGERAKAGRA